MKGAPCRPPASYVSAANSALDLDLFPSALHSQVSRRALFAPALPFPIRRMQTIEKRRYLGCVFCILMYPLRFSSERKRVCMADGNDSVRCKTARRLTCLCKAEGKRSRSRAEFAGGVLRTAKRSFGAVACVHCVQAAHEHGLFMDVRK